jgi:hypothetical protein
MTDGELETQANAIQKAVIAALKPAFHKAVVQSEAVMKDELTHISTAAEFNTFSEKAESRFKALEFLRAAEAGKYKTNEYPNMINGWDLWEDYLKDKGTASNGFGCMPSNERKVREALRENGETVINQDLTALVRNRIKAAQKLCTNSL